MANKALTPKDFSSHMKKRGHLKRRKQSKDALKQKKFSQLSSSEKEELLKQVALQLNLVQEED